MKNEILSKAGIIFLKHKNSQEGKHLGELMESLKHIDKDLLAHHDRTCIFFKL
jgi:hypothetical protein